MRKWDVILIAKFNDHNLKNKQIISLQGAGGGDKIK